MYDCMMRSLQHWSNDMHRLRRSQDEAHLVDPPIKTNRRTGGVCGAPVMVPTLDHSAFTVAELIHSRTLIDLLWIVSCLSTLSAKVQISSKIFKNHQIPGFQRAPDQQAALAVLSVWPAAPRFVEAGSRSMKQSKFDHTTWIWFNLKIFASSWYGISVQVGARGAVGHLKSSKIHQFLLKTGDSRHTFHLFAVGIWKNLSSLQWSLRIRWFHQSAHKLDAGAMKTHETKWNNLRSINCFLCAWVKWLWAAIL